MQNTNRTKRQLTLFFVSVVFVLMLTFSLSSSITKFAGAYNREKGEFENFIRNATEQIQKNQNFVAMLQRMHQFSRQNELGEKDNQMSKNTDFPGARDNINYISLSTDGSIIASSIQDTIADEMINSVIQDDRYYQMQYQDSFFIQKIKTDTGEFIAFKKLRYDASELLEDLILFFVIGLLFCGAIYFIGRGFVNRVFEPVEANLDDMKQFVHNAGHELKTPIAVMDSNIQLLLEMQSFDQEMTIEMKDELKKMNSLIDALIKLSDIGEFQNTENNPLGETIDEIIKNYSEKIQEKNLTVQTKIASETIVESNKNYLLIFLSNLIGNAIKYNTKNGNIDIAYHKGTLSIKDSGIGIATKDTKKIFDRFFQADASRQSDGFGIGLSLVKRIADVYNWKIDVISEENKGSEFIVRF